MYLLGVIVAVMNFVSDPATPVNGNYTAVIAVNDDVGDGFQINLRNLELDSYRKNPVVLWAHDRWDRSPIGRTLELRWTNRGLEAEFEFDKSPFAREIEASWRRGFVRGASIGCMKQEGSDNYELLEWSIVPVPADRDAVRALTSFNALAQRHQPGLIFSPVRLQEESVDEEKLRELIAEQGVDTDALVESLRSVIDESVKSAVAESEAKRQASEEEAARMKKKMEDDMKKKEDDEEEMAKKTMADAEDRADLLLLVRSLLPPDFKHRGKTSHEIMVAAVGSEVENAAERSEDYLLARLEMLAELRQRAAAPLPDVPAPTQSTGVIDVTRLRAA